MRGSSQANKISEIKVPINVRELNIRTKLPARYISWLSSARSSTGPVVGRFKTIAVIASPEIMVGNSQPIVLTNGLTANRTGYLNKSLLSETPLALAVITYCFPSSSRRHARIIRMSPAVPAVPITITGTQSRLSIFPILARLQAASTYSGEKRPVMGISR